MSVSKIPFASANDRNLTAKMLTKGIDTTYNYRDTNQSKKYMWKW